MNPFTVFFLAWFVASIAVAVLHWYVKRPAPFTADEAVDEATGIVWDYSRERTWIA